MEKDKTKKTDSAESLPGKPQAFPGAVFLLQSAIDFINPIDFWGVIIYTLTGMTVYLKPENRNAEKKSGKKRQSCKIPVNAASLFSP